MKKNLIFFLMFTTTLYLFACSELDENTGENHTDIEVYDFDFIYNAPETKEKLDFKEVIRIYLVENIDMLDVGYAVDIEKEHVYIDPRRGSRGVRTSLEDPVPLLDTNDFIDLVEKYSVEDWEDDYTFEDPSTYEDGYSWHLLLQFVDGTVKIYKGSGTEVDKITPENFSEFKKEFSKTVDEKIARN